MQEMQVSVSLFTLVLVAVSFVIGWFLGQYWKGHNLGQMSNAQRWQEVSTNSRAADYAQRVVDELPGLKARLTELEAKVLGPK